MGSNEEAITLPFWQVNVPASECTKECPDFLANLNSKDLAIINTPDSQYHNLSWAEVQQIITGNRLDLFQRMPSQLRRYLAYNWKLKQEYGSVMQFIMSQRLGWKEPIQTEAAPFKAENDVKILWNDWPYGIDAKIVHLVVWTKFPLVDDPKTGNLTDEAREEINDFVDQTFCEKVGKDNVSVM